MKENIIIRLERENEYHEVENLVRESFWNVYRPGCLEHYVLHQPWYCNIKSHNSKFKSFRISGSASFASGSSFIVYNYVYLIWQSL